MGRWQRCWRKTLLPSVMWNKLLSSGLYVLYVMLAIWWLEGWWPWSLKSDDGWWTLENWWDKNREDAFKRKLINWTTSRDIKKHWKSTIREESAKRKFHPMLSNLPDLSESEVCFHIHWTKTSFVKFIFKRFLHFLLHIKGWRNE